MVESTAADPGVRRHEPPAPRPGGTIDAATMGRSRDPFILLPPAIAAVLIAARRGEFGFDPPGWLDAFMYLGYFWHYPAHAPPLDQDYKSSRLPWILPSYVIHWLASPAIASYVLVFATLSAGGVALYLWVRDITRDRAAAAIIAAAWTSCTWVHGIGGWNYHMLAASDYFLAASWLAFRAASSGTTPAAVLSGACAAAAVHTHLLFAAFLPLLALTYWSGLPSHAPRGRRFFGAAVPVGGGAAGITLLLAAINGASGGNWLFFMPQIEQARKLARHDDWWQQARAWLPTATYLIVPLVLMLAGLAGLRRRGQHGPARMLVLQAWIALGLMCVAQFARHQATLSLSHLAFPLYVYAFACGGVALASWRSRRHPVALVAIGAVLIAGPLLLLMPERLPRALWSAASAIAPPGTAAVVMPLVFALAGGVLTIATSASARVLVFAAWFGVVNAWIAPAPSVYGMSQGGDRRELLELFRDADEMTAAFDPRLGGIRYWFANEPVAIRPGGAPIAYVFDSFIATRGWQFHLLAHDPGVPLQQLTLEQLERTVCIGLLASPQASRPLEVELQAHFAALGRPLRRITTRHLQRRDLAFDVTLLKPVDMPDGREPACADRSAATAVSAR